MQRRRRRSPPRRQYPTTRPGSTQLLHRPAPPPPIPTPTPMPIQVELTELLDEYDQNKVRANTRLRYQENGKIPISTSGYVDEVEELYVIITPPQEQYSSQKLYCYYSDTRAALHLTKGQLVSVTGRVRADDGYSNRVYMFACEFGGIGLIRIRLYQRKSFVRTLYRSSAYRFNLFHWPQRHRSHHRCRGWNYINGTSCRSGRKRMHDNRGRITGN